MSGASTKIDILAITETSEKEYSGFLSNVEIEGYEKYHTASKSAKGGTAIYVFKNLDKIERCDLNTSNLEFETTWIEIKNKNSKNIICGCIYRHPHNNLDDFFKYLERCLATLANENKEVYIRGDFNLDLLKIDTDHFTQYFFNLLCSYGMLPHILQPTRVTENTATVIDNIFSNNLQHDIISGNVLLTLSEHFSQFISVNREKLDLKNIIVYQRDYSKFSNESFRDDVSIQTWNYAHENVNAAFKVFDTKLEDSVSRHAPLKNLSPKEITDILKMIRIRNKIFTRKKRQPNNMNCKRLYNLFRNRVNRELKKSKKRYYEDYFTGHVNNIKKNLGWY